jgi:undecaprenyl diphosphate synthase
MVMVDGAKSIKKKIKYLTLFTFSTENWRRPQKEIKFLFDLLEYYLRNKLDIFDKQNIKFQVISSKKISSKLKSLINFTEKKTSKNSGLHLVIAFNYGSKTEILGAFKKLIKYKKKITEDNFSKYLQTKNIPDPDLLIRTGNTKRLSNFLLWQLAYTEIFFEKKLWPDFNEIDFRKIISSYEKTKRNYGGI